MTIHEKFPVGSDVRYLGGEPFAEEMGLITGGMYTITEHDILLGQQVAGFSPSNGNKQGDFYAIGDGTGGLGIIPNTAAHFELVIH